MADWACEICTLLNSPDSPTCVVCATRRPGKSFSSSVAIRRFGGGDVQQCPICLTATANGSCTVCQRSARRWTCPQCTLTNPMESNTCNVCGVGVNPQRQPPTSFTTPFGSAVQQTTSFQPRNSPLLPTHIDSEFMNDLRKIEESEAEESFNKIVRSCQQSRINFVDDSFPPTAKSIGTKPTTKVTMIDDYKSGGDNNNFLWLRPSDIRAEPRGVPFVVIRSDASPADIKQGVLGNCWFLSALAVVAERPDLLGHILLQKAICREGVYQVRICWEGQWRVVLVDDYFPCHENKTVAYSQARRKQLWVQLIEKGLAKLHGSYNALTGGQTIEGLSLLTGCPCEVIRLQKDADHGDEQFDVDLTWARLLSAREAGFLMGASCGGNDSLQLDDGVLKSMGLLPLHAYSVLDVRQNGPDRLVHLRNPWGQFSWKGKWSDDCDSWTPVMRKEFCPDKSAEGIFWISFDDLRSFFDRIDVCKVRSDWNEIRMRGLLPPHATQNYVYMSVMDITETTEVVLTLFQQGCRREKLNKHGVLDLMLSVFRMTDVGYVGQLVFSSKRELKAAVSCDAVLQPGIYCIFTTAFVHFGMDLKPDDIPNSVITFHSTKKLSVNHMVTDSLMLCQALTRLVISKGERYQSREGMVTYFMSQGWSGLIILVENSHPHRHVHITCDCSRSENVVSTRGVLFTSDSIPPMHRQILIILTQVDASFSYLVSHKITHRMASSPYLQDWAAKPSDTHQPPMNDSIGPIHSPMRIF